MTSVIEAARWCLDILSSRIDAAFGQRIDFVSQFFGVEQEAVQRPTRQEDAASLYLLARQSMRVGDLAGALALLDRSRSASPMLEDAAEGYGEVLDQLGNRSEAISMYTEGRRIRGAHRGATPDRPMVLRRNGRITTEIVNYTWLLQQGNDTAFVYIARGNAELALRKPKRAIADYSAALGLCRNIPSVLALKGEAHAMLGQYDFALRDFNLALDQNADDPDILGGRAIVHLACDRQAFSDADWFRQLQLLPPSRASARACVALRLAEYPTARAELDRALEAQPNDLYWCLYRLTAARRIGEPFVPGQQTPIDQWPAPLIELHAGRMTTDEVLVRADNRDRQAEAHFQLGVLSMASRKEGARDHFRLVIALSSPASIEHAAARHELMRWGL